MEPSTDLDKNNSSDLKTQDQWLEEAQQLMIRYCGDFTPIVIERAKGSYIYTTNGKAILDFTSGQMCSVFGHNHPKVLEAMSKAGAEAVHLLSTILSPPVISLCKELAEMLPEGLDKTILLNTGAESNEVALRMAKLASGGFEILGYTGSWHGMTAGAQSSTYAGHGTAMVRLCRVAVRSLPHMLIVVRSNTARTLATILVWM